VRSLNVERSPALERWIQVWRGLSMSMVGIIGKSPGEFYHLTQPLPGKEADQAD
jgi:hypothetical protein